MTAHSKLFSPSSAERWMNCTASAELNAKVEDKGSKYAQEGSVAHHLAELSLKGKHRARWTAGMRIETPEGIEWEIDWEMCNAVGDYVDYCHDLECDESWVEARYDLSHIADGMFGTSDFTGIAGKRLHVVDLKYGKGIAVYAENNPQAMLYALGALEELDLMYDIEDVQIHIHQPRLEHVDSWVVSIEELREFESKARAAAINIQTKNVAFKATEKGCQWCKVKATCAEFAKMATREAQDVFADVGGFEPEEPQMSPEDRAKALESIPLLKQWIKAMEEGALSDIEHGVEIPGWKVVEGRSFRKWGDEDQVMDILKRSRGAKEDDYVKKSLLSVAQLEKVFKPKKTVWGKLEPLITKGEGKHTLVPESDKRPSIGRPEDAFSDID